LTNLLSTVSRFRFVSPIRYLVALYLLAMTVPSLALPTKLPPGLKYTNPARVFVSLQKLQNIDVEVNREIRSITCRALWFWSREMAAWFGAMPMDLALWNRCEKQ